MQPFTLLLSMTALAIASPIQDDVASEKRQDHKTIFVTANTNWSGLRAWVPVANNVMYAWSSVIFEDGENGSSHGPGSLGPDPEDEKYHDDITDGLRTQSLCLKPLQYRVFFIAQDIPRHGNIPELTSVPAHHPPAPADHQLRLPYCSPHLLNARDLELAVPGTYRSGQEVVRIMSFDSNFTVISYKQRPRKLHIMGSDGVAYRFLLKGHEDIRQDERVMQLFGLCNTLLSNDSETIPGHAALAKLGSHRVGLNSDTEDTVHSLIRDYRESRKILLNIQHRVMLQMAPDYDNLTFVLRGVMF
ncbi:kinase-like domain-containing protein [Coniochaeta sp. 2T2.1]|nr:kinase-like domain-containing protein [Coniochaeta sp. 2T2.1]